MLPETPPWLHSAAPVGENFATKPYVASGGNEPPVELDELDELDDDVVGATAVGSGPLPKSGEPLAYAPATTMLPASSMTIEVGLAGLLLPPSCQGDAHTPAGLQ